MKKSKQELLNRFTALTKKSLYTSIYWGISHSNYLMLIKSEGQKILVLFPNGDIRLKILLYEKESISDNNVFREIYRPYFKMFFHGCIVKAMLLDIENQGAKFAFVDQFSKKEIKKLGLLTYLKKCNCIFS